MFIQEGPIFSGNPMRLILADGDGSGGSEGTGAGAEAGEGAEAGAGEFTWRGQLSDEHQKAPALESFEDSPEGLANLAKSYLSAQEAFGKRIPLPKDANDATAWDELYNKLGRPKAPDDYNYDSLKTDLKWPEGTGPDEGTWKRFSGVFHKLGLSQSQAAGLAKEMAGYQLEGYTRMTEEMVAQRDAALTTLKESWGNEFDSKMKVAETVLGRMTRNMKPEVRARVVQAVGNIPEFAQMLVEMGASLREDGKLTGGGDKRGGGMTPAEAKVEIGRIEADPKHPYWDRSHRDHGKALDTMTALYAAAYPEAK